MFYRHKTPGFVQSLFPSLLWHEDRSKQNVYLTFDDGPVPELTPAILKILHTFNAKATFFCVGENIRKHPDIFRQVIDDGHAIGNHTQHHLDGWKHNKREYLDDVEECRAWIEKKGSQSTLFRPPYGKLSLPQMRALKERYKIVMWDVLSADFDRNLSPDQCYDRMIPHVKEGSVIVFHDNLKAARRVLNVLPRLLENIRKRGWECLPLH